MVLIAVGVGVYAATYAASGAGHPYTEISTCGANQVLQMNSAGNAWTCANLPAQTSLTGTLNGICMMVYKWKRTDGSFQTEDMNTKATFVSSECSVRAAPATCGGTSNYCTCPSGYTRQFIVTGAGVPQGGIETFSGGYYFRTIFTFTCVQN